MTIDDSLVLLIAGVIAVVLAVVQELRTDWQDLSSWAAGVLGAALVVVYFLN